MKTVPGQILLEIKQQTNSFLVKQNSNGSSKVQFSEYINNLCNSHSFKFAGFLDGVSKKVDRCQQCNRVGHMKDRCFDFHPCEHYVKAKSLVRQMFHKEEYCKRETKFRMDCFLGMVESSQEDLQDIPQDLFKSVNKICSGKEYFLLCIQQGGNCWWFAIG